MNDNIRVISNLSHVMSWTITYNYVIYRYLPHGLLVYVTYFEIWSYRIITKINMSKVLTRINYYNFRVSKALYLTMCVLNY